MSGDRSRETRAKSPAERRMLITAGPTHEPIDSVRYLGNRSSGRLGVALADHASAAGWEVTLLLGPTHLVPANPTVSVHRYRTAAELGALLEQHQGGCEVLVMAAAVADYRPKTDPSRLGGKLKRSSQTLTIELERTEDLLAACSRRRTPGQMLVGFALEPADRLLASAREKLTRKGVDLIVANPLDTMESDSIEAVVLGTDGTERRTGGPIAKAAFAPWLLEIIARSAESRRAPSAEGCASGR